VVLRLGGSLHRQSDLAGVGVLSYVRASVRRDDQYPRHLGRVVSYLMTAFWSSREWNSVSLVELAVAVVQSHGRLTPADDDQLLAPVVEVVDELRATRLKLPERSAERPGSDEALRPYSAPVGNVRPYVLRFTRHRCHSTTHLELGERARHRPGVLGGGRGGYRGLVSRSVSSFFAASTFWTSSSVVIPHATNRVMGRMN